SMVATLFSAGTVEPGLASAVAARSPPAGSSLAGSSPVRRSASGAALASGSGVRWAFSGGGAMRGIGAGGGFGGGGVGFGGSGGGFGAGGRGTTFGAGGGWRYTIWTCRAWSASSRFWFSPDGSSGFRDSWTASNRSAACIAALKPREIHGRSVRSGGVGCGSVVVPRSNGGRESWVPQFRRVAGRSGGRTVRPPYSTAS